MAALADAHVALFRATECDRIGPVRAMFLREARDALQAAGFPRWSELAEAAAQRIGGGDGDVRRLFVEVERAIERQGRRAA